MSKLTLSVDARIISRAKNYARQKGMSVSEMVETYLAAVSGESSSTPRKATPILDSVRGSLKKTDLRTYKKYLVGKYR